MTENVDRCILGAFRCVDAVTGTPVATPCQAQSPQLDIRRNRSGTFVVFDGPGMHALTNDFDMIGAWPAPRAFDVSVTGGGGRYFPRHVQVFMPRKRAPISDADSILNPQDVPLYLEPAAPLSPTWAVIRLSVSAAGSGLPWVVARVTRDSDGQVLATGMGNDMGEVLVAVPGLSTTAAASAGGAVLQTTVAATVQVVFDPSLRTKAPEDINPDLTLASLNNPTFKTASLAAVIGRGTSNHFPMSISI